jgi:hypothetical protein
MPAGIRSSLAALLRIVVLLTVLGALAPAAPVLASGPTDDAHFFHHRAPEVGMSPLVDKVRTATARYLDINVARNEGWVPATPCVSGPMGGAMGVHMVLPSRLGDGMLNANEPEALIYEPLPTGAMRLVGVEFIVMASDWAQRHPDGSPAAVDGHLANYVGEPNRYGLHAFYELHVWAWQDNPNGNFADFNTRVTCDNQPAS